MLPRTSAVGTPALRQSVNQNSVQITLSDNCQAKQKKKIDRLARLPIWQLHPIRPHLLPRGNHLADDWIDRLGKCCARFVDRNIEHANCTTGQNLISGWHGNILPLPANAAEAQT